MVAGLHGGGGDVTEEEEEPGKPQDAMDEGRDAFVEPNAPLHPSLVDVAADVAMQVPAQKCDHRLSLPDWCNGFAAMALVPRRRASSGLFSHYLCTIELHFAVVFRLFTGERQRGVD